MGRSQTESQAGEGAAHLEALQDEMRHLQARLAQLTDEVSRNDSLLRKTQERELELLRAGSLTDLFERLIQGLRASYGLDEVALILHDPQHEIRHLLSGDATNPTEPPGVCFVDALVTVAPQLANLDRPWLGPYRKADHELLVPGLAPPGSLALIPLRRSEQLDGVLVFSSSDPVRFTSELASDFLAHLGLVAAICVENGVNRARLTAIAGDTNSSPALRGEAVQQLGVMHAGDELARLYARESAPEVKKRIIQGLFISRDATRLVELAKAEKDMDLKKDIVQKLSLMKSKEATDYLVELLK